MKIYFAAPFSNKKQKNGLIDESYKKKLLSIEKKLKALGCEVFLPHRDLSKWGKVKATEIVHLWEQTIKESDLLLAIIGAPESPGVCLEIGLAIAHKKPVILLNEKNAKISDSLTALQKMENVKLIKFNSLNELFEKLGGELK